MSSPRHPQASASNLQTGARIALFGLAINVFLAGAKILAGLIGHAYVLIADGIESALDVGGSIVIWGGLTVAARPPDATHPYGHGKAEPIAAVVVAVGVLAAALGLAIQSEAWQSADDWAALFACALIGANGYRLLRPALFEIMDTAPRGKIVRSIRRAAGSVPGVIEVEKCRARKMGLDFYVDLHVGVDGSISVHEGHKIAHQVKRAIQQSDSRIADVLVHIEPAR